jgi:acetyltransferase-like isoleucine patch superfamily enzyme
MPSLRSLLEYWKRLSLRRYRKQVCIAASTRLLRRFSVSFFSPIQDRIYLRVGENCMLNAVVIFESPEGVVEIGDRAYIGNDTSIISRNRVTIGNDVTMAWGITIYDHNSHSFDWRQRALVVEHFFRTYGTPNCFEKTDWTDVASAPITICDRAWIGFGAVILKGVTIGEGAIIGACSVVSRDVEPYTVVAGNPAVPIRRIPPQFLDGPNDEKK